jgi:primosomal protein N' (replication factor Y)
MPRTISIIINGTTPLFDKEYTYFIPEEITQHIEIGMRVLVNFGTSKKPRLGIVFSEPCEDENALKFKPILEILDTDPILTHETFELVKELKETTFCVYFDAVKILVPNFNRIPKSNRKISHKISAAEKKYISDIKLSDKQFEVFEKISKSLEQDNANGFLLQGITGSGKTSIYKHLIAKTLEMGKTAMLLVPEISLTPQTVIQFEELFGENIAVLHSGLSASKRYGQFRRIKNGDAKVVIGTRSAVFAPLENIGIIIIDEEQEQTYKSEQSPRYSAINVARWRTRYHGAVLLLASATPSVTDYYLSEKGVYTRLELNERYGNVPLPKVEIVDMKKERNFGNYEQFSKLLLDEIHRNLICKEQTILLLNRRGYQTSIVCGDCDSPVYCSNCSVSLVYHKSDKMLHCHYCGVKRNMPPVCENCGSNGLIRIGYGTQKLEEKLTELFPAARILRMDSDTINSKNTFESNFKAFANKEYDIMLGTQMIGKGIDFPNVTLVGVLSVDNTLYTGDFSGYERTFSLITQVVGRSGRGDKEGRAVLQTFLPDHPIINLASQQNYREFYDAEIAVRSSSIFPPACSICTLGFSNTSETDVKNAVMAMLNIIREEALKTTIHFPLRVLGPVSDGHERIAGKYRLKLILKCKNNRKFRDFMRNVFNEYYKNKIVNKTAVYIDFN